MRKMLRDQRAVSEVIATVLLILLVTIGMGILFGFVVSYTSNYQTGQGSSVLESLTVEDVWFGHPSSNQIDMWVYNTGKVSVTVNSIYVNGALIDPNNPTPESIVLNGNPVTNSQAIPVNGHAEFLISYSLTENSSYDIKIVTSRGSSFEGNYYYS